MNLPLSPQPLHRPLTPTPAPESLRSSRSLTRWLALGLIALGSVALQTGCGDTAEEPPVGEEPGDVPEAGVRLASELPRDLDPGVDEATLDALVAGNTAFAVDLYHALRAEEGNLFNSPLSISTALAMTYGGARGETADEMAAVMHYDLGQEGTHPAFNALGLALDSRGQAAVEDGDPFRLHIVNDVWGRTDYAFEASYLDLLALNYGAGLRLLDYVNDPEGSREIINEYIESQTEELIKDLLPEGSITAGTVLVLTNAVYFKASWDTPFEESLTEPAPFNLLGGGVVEAQMMRQDSAMGYAEGEGFQAIEMDYKGNELSMVIIAPEAGAFAQFEADLSAERLTDIIDGIEPGNVSLRMPKFKFSDDTGLTQTLQDMGMVQAFNGGDLSGINGVGGLEITDVLHKAFVAVDEAGTEAAAATAVVVGETSVPVFSEVNLDRPFIFLIRDIETGAILFLGRVVDPTR